MGNYSNYESQVLGLAGATLAAKLVADLAHQGDCDTQELRTMVESLFKFDPATSAGVYGGLQPIHQGLTRFSGLLSQPGEEHHRDLLRYLFGMMHLEQRMSQNEDMTRVVHSRLKHAALNYSHFTGQIDQTCTSLAAIYQDTLSTLAFRIQVTGKVENLEKDANAARIRSLLLAGVRSIHLWRQHGGARWRVILFRNRFRSTADDLIARAS